MFSSDCVAETADVILAADSLPEDARVALARMFFEVAQRANRGGAPDQGEFAHSVYRLLAQISKIHRDRARAKRAEIRTRYGMPIIEPAPA